MKRGTFCVLALGMIVTLLCIMPLTAAQAKEIWIAPEKLAAGKTVGNWAVTNEGDTHFSFGVPEDMTAFQKAKVVVIGLKTGAITYDLKLSVAKPGESHKAFTDAQNDKKSSVALNVLKEIDKDLTRQKQFKEASFVADVVKKGIEVSYNFANIVPESAGSRMGILSFSLIFYVIYTLWWGLAVMYLFEGVGLQMTAGTKKEV